MSDTFQIPAAPSAPIAAPSPERWAQVQVANRVTRYVRRGSGHPPVVVLHSPDDSRDELWPGLVEAIAARCRVLIPEPPAVDAEFLAWLRGFLDGVGLPAVTLVATNRFCLPAFELALLDPERLSGLVLIPRGRAQDTGLTGALGPNTAGGGTVPVLVVRRECPTAEALPLVERFVSVG